MQNIGLSGDRCEIGMTMNVRKARDTQFGRASSSSSSSSWHSFHSSSSWSTRSPMTTKHIFMPTLPSTTMPTTLTPSMRNQTINLEDPAPQPSSSPNDEVYCDLNDCLNGECKIKDGQKTCKCYDHYQQEGLVCSLKCQGLGVCVTENTEGYGTVDKEW